MRNMKPVPPEVVAEAIRQFNPTVSQFLDETEESTEFETQFLVWFAQFHTKVSPYIGNLPLPATTRQDKGAKV